MRRLPWVCLGVMAALWCGGRVLAVSPVPTDPAAPTDSGVPIEETTTTAPGSLPPALGPLVAVPSGCAVPPPATAVFIGRLTTTDIPPTTARFRMETMLAGSLEGYSAQSLVDVRYGESAHFLSIDTEYVVGVAVDPGTGLLVSTVREAAPLFGGDAVIGANDSDIDCPRVEDPVRTLLADGSPVDTGVLTPLKGHSSSILAAVVKPLAIAFGVLVALVLLKQLLFAVGRSVRDMADSAGSGRRSRGPREARHRHHGRASGVAETLVVDTVEADTVAADTIAAGSGVADQPGA